MASSLERKDEPETYDRAIRGMAEKSFEEGYFRDFTAFLDDYYWPSIEEFLEDNPGGSSFGRKRWESWLEEDVKESKPSDYTVSELYEAGILEEVRDLGSTEWSGEIEAVIAVAVSGIPVGLTASNALEADTYFMKHQVYDGSDTEVELGPGLQGERLNGQSVLIAEERLESGGTAARCARKAVERGAENVYLFIGDQRGRGPTKLKYGMDPAKMDYDELDVDGLLYGTEQPTIVRTDIGNPAV